MSRDTCWTMIHAAADGDSAARAFFARTYLPVVRTYLAARWRQSPLRGEIDDVVQNVFVECFRARGVIDTADPEHPRGFRSYLLGVTRHAAADLERDRARHHRRREEGLAPEKFESDETGLSTAFDRAFARALMREAARRQQAAAEAQGEAALQRVEMLRLRFAEDLPVREIAGRLGIEPSVAHHEYAQARIEFKRALREVVAFHHPGDATSIEKHCEELLAILK